MRKLQEILRLKESGVSNRNIANSINVSPSTVSLLLSSLLFTNSQKTFPDPVIHMGSGLWYNEINESC